MTVPVKLSDEEDAPLADFPEWQHDAMRIAGAILETDHYLPLPTKFDIHAEQKT